MPLALAPASGLCPECASSADTADPTLRSSAPPDLEPSTATADPLSPSAGPFAATGSLAVAADTGSYPTAAPAPFPHAPAGYELLDRLGGGGMGEVFLARESTSERLVAMKFLRFPGSPDALERFVLELRALARIDHKNVVRVLASDFLRSDPFFTMEHMPNGSLAGQSPLPPAEAVKLVRAVAEALAVAHAGKIIHRDLKPSNILLAADGTPKLSDFGLAKFLDADPSLTLASGALGTVQYMPPEQVTSRNGKIGPWSDVFGLGATLYHLLSGRPPFTGDSAQEIILKVVGEQPPRLRDIPPALEGIVLKCLEKETEDRYQSMAELIADLDRFTAKQRPKAPPLTRWRRAKRWAKRNRRAVPVAALSVLLVVGAFVLGAAYWPKPKPPEPLEEIRKELRAGRSVVLIGESGRPKHSRWLIGTATVIEPTDADPAFAFEAPQPTQLELLSNPGVEQYRITGEFQLRYHKAIVNTGGRQTVIGMEDVALFGIYCGDVLLATGDGHSVRVSMVAGYTDYYSKEVCDKLPKLHGAAQLETAAIVPAPGGLLESRTASAGKVLRFPPTDALPTPWRRLRVDVAPAGVKMFWAASPTADWQLVSERTVGELANDLNQKTDKLNVKLAAHAPIIWNPAASCGVWCRGAAVAVRNVTVEVP